METVGKGKGKGKGKSSKRSKGKKQDDQRSFLGVESTQEPINVDLVTKRQTIQEEMQSNRSLSNREKKKLLTRTTRSGVQKTNTGNNNM